VKLILPLLLTFICATNAYAIVIGEDAQQSPRHEQPQEIERAIKSVATPSSSFPYWGNVGMVGMGTGVYLGDGWVLTSTHVGCLPFKLSDGTIYRPLKGTWNVLSNSDGTRSDIAVFRVDIGDKQSSIRKLPDVVVNDKALAANSPVVLIGTGFVEVESKNEASEVSFGSHIRSVRRKRWAMASLDQALKAPAATAGGLRTRSFATSFCKRPFAGQAAEGDSGGPAFVYDALDKRWELAGCIFAVSQLSTFVPYGARTYVGDLTAYRNQIAGHAAGSELATR
jgi:hypothetical protein